MIHCIIVANSRPAYLDQVCDALELHHPGLPYIVVNDDHHEGMAVNVQHGWDTFLSTDATHLLHLEDDMVLTDKLPFDEAKQVLDDHPWVAQMCFRREPWWGNPAEMTTGDQLRAIVDQATDWELHPTWTEHNFLFSLNPCLIPRHVVEKGWDYDNEAGMTARLRQDAFLFGSWGRPGDGQTWARHIGEQRGPEWKL